MLPHSIRVHRTEALIEVGVLYWVCFTEGGANSGSSLNFVWSMESWGAFEFSYASRPGLVHAAESKYPGSLGDRGRQVAQILHGILTSVFLSY
jgi:hypothetical protein